MKTLRQLHVGAKFADERLWNIVFRVADRDLGGYPGTIGVTDSIVNMGYFDMRETRNPDKKRRERGNNHYQTSNIRQWLNSGENKWYEPQHEFDAPPPPGRIDGDWGPYERHVGFLAAFSDAFKSALIEAKIKTQNALTGDIEITKDRVWLLSAREVGIEPLRVDGKDEGESFSIFSDFRMRVAAPMWEVAFNFNLPDSQTSREYWLRSANTAYSDTVRLVRADGGETSVCAEYDHLGIRPAVLLRSDTPVSDEPDERGVYLIG